MNEYEKKVIGYLSVIGIGIWVFLGSWVVFIQKFVEIMEK